MSAQKDRRPVSSRFRQHVPDWDVAVRERHHLHVVPSGGLQLRDDIFHGLEVAFGAHRARPDLHLGFHIPVRLLPGERGLPFLRAAALEQ